ncbi:GDSL-type esterase/lipase family protein [Candidatus Uabimicrobium amorphum]|uniref:SGNH hydrolase-type esterase domain-containing protein n=1 Tax=Uabimicrobium amorphum TaxID=2596890 RepID=A0A5S9INI0_UABAM|nr:GDSL-type esterase/lipase family protein [Candidatus Uabimicrobium amorphum]BBM84790.1 hypothetical protein UABAM_03151 [Candidatus Uabimicrobium amorphum]
MPLFKILIVAFILTNIGFAQENYYEKTIQQFEAQDKKEFPAQDSVLFVGSSSIRLWKSLSNDFPEIKTINRGFGGSQTSDVLHFVDRIVTLYKPKAIVFYCGENDIAGKKDISAPVEDFEKFISHVRKKLPQTTVYYVSMKPSPSRWHMWEKMAEANRQIEKFCKQNSMVDKRKTLDYIDVSATMIRDGKPDKSIFIQDMLHMNAEGYARWTKIIRKKLIDDKFLTEDKESKEDK